MDDRIKARIREDYIILIHPTKENDTRFKKYPSWLIQLFHHTRIREETNDRFSYIIEKKRQLGYSSIISGIFMGVIAYIFIAYGMGDVFSYLLNLIFIGSSAYAILWGLFAIMVCKLVTVDKKSQRVIIKRDSRIDFIKSVKEIPFSNI